MKDVNGVEIKIGDHVILPVSWGSEYLTSATVIDILEDKDELYIQYDSTPKFRSVDNNVFVCTPFPRPLGAKNKDCMGQEVVPGDYVVYRKARRPLKIARVIDIDNGVFLLDSGIEVKGVSIYKKGN